VRDFFPTGALDENINQNRLKLKAEAAPMLHRLTDAHCTWHWRR